MRSAPKADRSFQPLSLYLSSLPAHIRITLQSFQCILSAIAAVLVAATAERAYTRQAALIAGIIFAFYPGFIVNTGRLYSESFGVFLFACVLYLAVRGFERRNSLKHLFWLGFALVCLQLTRSTIDCSDTNNVAHLLVATAARAAPEGHAYYSPACLACSLPGRCCSKRLSARRRCSSDRTGNYSISLATTKKLRAG